MILFLSVALAPRVLAQGTAGEDNARNLLLSVYITWAAAFILFVIFMLWYLRVKRLQKKSEERARRLRLVHEVSTQIVEQTDLDDILQRIVEEMVRITDSEKAAIFLREPETENIAIRYSHGFGEETRKLMFFTPDQGLIGLASRTRNPIMVNDTSKDPRAVRAITDPEKIKRLIHVPILGKRGLVGILNVNNKRGGDYTQDDLTLLSTLADQVAIAIEKAELIEELRESEEKYRNLIDQANDVIFITTTDLALTFLNRKWEDYLGYGKYNSLGKKYTDYVHPADTDKINSAFENVEKKQHNIVEQYRMRNSTGGWKYFTTALSSLRDDDGEIIGVFGISRDVTEIALENIQRDKIIGTQKIITDMVVKASLSEVLHETSKKIGELYGAHWVGITLLDESGTYFQYQNGWNVPKEIEELKLDTHPHASFASKIAAEGYCRCGNYRKLQASFVKSVQHLITSMEGVPLKDNVGKVIGVLTLYNDEEDYFQGDDEIPLMMISNQLANVIQQKKLEEKIREQNRELEIQNQRVMEATRMKSQFLASMSHELRTPMNSIIGFTEVVLNKTPDLPESRRKNLEIVLRNARHLLHLINDVLDLSKVESGKITLQPEKFDFKDLLEDCVGLVRTNALAKGLELITDLDPEIPIFYTDRMKLRQILINLVTNAIKFTEKGSVKVRAFEENGWLECSVVDTGIGISKEDQNRVFEEFHQVKSGQTKSDEGSGLGLTLTKKLIELLGGTISIESEPGKGSTFTFRMPNVLGTTREISLISPEVAASAAISMLEMQTEVPDKTGKGKKQILCIDDNPDVAELMREHLSSEGFSVQVALSAEEGLKKIRKNKPFAVMLDILMPQKNGWEFLREIKKDKDLADIPVIIVSIVDNKKLGFALGASDYIVKPFDKEAILKALQKLMLPRDANILIVEDNPDDVQLMCEILRENYPNLLIASNGRKALEMLDKNLPSLILLDLMMPVMDGMEFLEEMKRNPRWMKTPVMVVTAKALTQEDYNRLNGNIHKVLHKNSMTKERLAIEVNKLLSSLE